MPKRSKPLTRSTKIAIGVVNGVAVVLMALCLIFFLNTMEWYLQTACYVLVAVFGVGVYVLLALDKQTLAKTCFVCNMTLFVVMLCFFVLNVTGLFQSLDDMDKVKQLILDSGSWGYVVCFAIQLLQVVVLPAPGWVFYLATTAVYGPWQAFLICYVATVVGSLISFAIGRIFGKKAVAWCIGKEQTEKYSTMMEKHGKLPFVMMQLLPFFPDDILCMVAGLSNMSYKFFLLVIVLVRPIYIALVCFLGTGQIIPFSGWGIPVWIAIFAVVAVLCVLYFKNKSKVDAWLHDKFGIEQ